MAKLADAKDLKSLAERRTGSILFPGIGYRISAWLGGRLSATGAGNVNNAVRAEVLSILAPFSAQGLYPHNISPDDRQDLGLRQNLERNNQVDAKAILVSLPLSSIRQGGSQAKF